MTPQGRRASTARGYLDRARGRPDLTITRPCADRSHYFCRQARERWASSGWRERARSRQKRRPTKRCCCAPGRLPRRRSCSAPAWVTRSCSGSSISRWCTISPAWVRTCRTIWRCICEYECKEPVSLYPALQWWNQPKIGAEWLFGGTGIGASNQFEAGGFIRSRAEFRLAEHSVPLPAGGD